MSIIKPDNVIDAALPPHMKRVMEEGDQLSERLSKLGTFMQTPGFKALMGEDQILLSTQFAAMTAYLNILTIRVTRAREVARFNQARYGNEAANTGKLDRH
jgi:hypothetical protein